MYLPNTARSVLRARPVRGAVRAAAYHLTARVHGPCWGAARDSCQQSSHTRTGRRYGIPSFVQHARGSARACCNTRVRAHSYHLRALHFSWSLGKTVFIGARAPLSRQTSLCADARRGTCPHNHARLTHVVAHTSARTIVISNSELSSWHSHGATSLWYLPAAGAPDRVWNPSNECLGAHPAHQMPPPRCAPPRFDDRSLAF